MEDLESLDLSFNKVESLEFVPTSSMCWNEKVESLEFEAL
jgi:hypothetical protein